MRRGPSNGVRVLAVCARCNRRPDLYNVRHIAEVLTTPSGPRLHELVVCRDCDRRYAGAPTVFEGCAMLVDAGDPIATMAFIQDWGCLPDRVQRTTEYFIGPEHYALHRARLLEEREEQCAKRAQEDDDWAFSPWDDDDDFDGQDADEGDY